MVPACRLAAKIRPVKSINQQHNLTFVVRHDCPSKDINGDKKGAKNVSAEPEYPEEPTTCCMSGCANCVWLEYAEKLSKFYRDGGDQALEQIKEKVTDPSMRAFLLHEMRMRQQEQK